MKTAQYLAAFGLALLLGLGAGQVLAQSATAEPEPEPATQPAAPADQADQTDDGAAMPDAALNPDAQDIAQVGDDPDNSPGRFIPTEQLSQDLGASFPVDI
jgi:hypothetical protein